MLRMPKDSNSPEFMTAFSMEEMLLGTCIDKAGYILLAAHFTMQANKELGNRRTVLQAKVTNILSMLDGMQRPDDRSLQVVKGFALMLSAGRAQDADAQFVSVIREKSDNIMALAGRACLAFNRQDYISSLGFFKSILMAQPLGPADVRVGIGHCFRNMGELDKARRSFELALVHNSRCQSALVGMALLKLNQLEKESTQEGINLLCASFEMNSRQAVVMSILATHFYYVRDYENVLILAGNAYKRTDIPQLQSQNCFQIARTFHATKQFDQAMKFYQLSVRLAPEGYVLPRMGLAQMLLRGGKIDMAKTNLEIFLEFLPNENRAMLLLAKIYLQERTPGQIDKALNMLSKVVKSGSARHDIDSRLTLAFACEQKQLWEQASTAYSQAIQISTELGQAIQIEWFNNLAATQMQAKKPLVALKTLDEAIFQCGIKGGDHRVTNLLTMRFNRARILEDLHKYDLAETAYKDIINDYPSYYDCYLRLGVMAMQQNKLAVASEYFKDVLNTDNDGLTARIYMADCFMKLSLSKHAIVNYNAILRNCTQVKATYTMVALGNFCLKMIHSALIRGDLSSVKRQQKRALRYYGKVLNRSPRNLWAANGIGAALSSCNNLSEGEAIFRHIIEAGNECPPAILNSAHIALELGQYKQASQTYKQCLQDFLPVNCVEVMHYLARALYGEGKAREAKMWLLKARHLAPHDPSLMFNLALTIKKDADQVFVLPRPKSNDLKRAELELKVAHKYFYHLYQNATSISVSACAKGWQDCEDLLTDLPEELQRVGNLELSNVDRIRLQEQRFLAHQQQLEAQRIQRQEEERVLRENQIAKRQEILERTKQIMNAPLQSELAKKESTMGKGRGQKNRKNVDADGEQNSDDQFKKNTAQKSRKRTTIKENKSAKKCKTREFIDTDDDDSEVEAGQIVNLESGRTLEQNLQSDSEMELNDDGEPEETEKILDRLKEYNERHQLEMENFTNAQENGSPTYSELE
ncbi:hypothetical protein M5D96_009659 [Drosophila gunungcola]|uniref:RNA polymerase-associated protein CTR9 homolog n=2 Tax=Drosophila gunungcola TaxID=103775 RepID=A0A9Q0BMD1_9MUSC|nr:hypothetical protein M5D96_009659 [Drosophila gunungcola]